MQDKGFPKSAFISVSAASSLLLYQIASVYTVWGNNEIWSFHRSSNLQLNLPDLATLNFFLYFDISTKLKWHSLAPNPLHSTQTDSFPGLIWCCGHCSTFIKGAGGIQSAMVRSSGCSGRAGYCHRSLDGSDKQTWAISRMWNTRLMHQACVFIWDPALPLYLIVGSENQSLFKNLTAPINSGKKYNTKIN